MNYANKPIFVQTNYTSILNILGVLCVDRICTEDHSVDNRTKKSIRSKVIKSYSDLFMKNTFFFQWE